MHRSVGISRAVVAERNKVAYAEKGRELAEANLAHIKSSLEEFKQNLVDFAHKHRKDIIDNPNFRIQFQQMCSKIGVDPLASNKGYWGEVSLTCSFSCSLCAGWGNLMNCVVLG